MAGTLLRLAVAPVDAFEPFAPFFLLLTLTFLLLGVLPGLLSAAFTATALYYVFTPPYWQFGYNPGGMVDVATYLLSAVPLGIAVRRLADTRRDVKLLAGKQEVMLSSELVGIAKLKDRRILWANAGLERLLGYGPGEMAGMSTRQFYPDAATYESIGAAAYQALRQTGTFQTEILMRRRDGETVWVNVSASPLRDEEDVSLWIFVSVHEWKQAEAALSTSQTFLETIGDIAGIGGWQLDVATKTSIWTAQTCRLHDVAPGFSPTLDEALAFYTPEARPVIAQAARDGIENGTPWDLELELVSATGRKFWGRATGKAERDANGRVVRLIGAFQDITERKHAARALEDSEARLRLSLAAGNIGVWQMDLERQTMWHDARASRMCDGVLPADTLLAMDGPELAVWEQRIGSETRAARRQAISALHEGMLAEVSVSYEARRADGGTIWLTIKGIGLDRDPRTGRFRSAFGVILDGTEEELARRRLREREAEARTQAALLKSLYTTARAGLCFVDRDLRIVEVNAYIAALFGRPIEDCIGRSRAELGNHNAAFVERLMRQVIETGEPIDCLEWRAAPAAQPDDARDWLMSLHPVLDETGVVIGVGESVVEITAQKRTEQALKQANAELQALAHSDGLTALANRRRFDEALARECAVAARTGAPVSLVLLDIDHFKAFNDLYGHQGGDDCLCAVASALLSVTRQPGDLVARYGGEEFAILLPATDAAGAAYVAEHARMVIEALALRHGGNPCGGGVVTVSAGIGSTDGECDRPGTMSAAHLVAAADRRLYEAKNAGRNRVRPCLSEPGTLAARLRRRFDDAIHKREALRLEQSK